MAYWTHAYSKKRFSISELSIGSLIVVVLFHHSLYYIFLVHEQSSLIFSFTNWICIAELTCNIEPTSSSTLVIPSSECSIWSSISRSSRRFSNTGNPNGEPEPFDDLNALPQTILLLLILKQSHIWCSNSQMYLSKSRFVQVSSFAMY